MSALTWPAILGVLALLGGLVVTGAAVATGIHVVLTKRDARAAAAWLGLVVLVPLLGVILYLLLGVNRIRRRATVVRRGESVPERDIRPVPDEPTTQSPVLLDHGHPLATFAHLGDVVLEEPLAPGNAVEPLHNGDEAYPAMLEAIAGAERSVALATFIFDADEVGWTFADALAEARERGAEVRVLVDSVGARYSRPTIFPDLAVREIPHASFLPPRIPWPWQLPFVNLRNHRKLLVVDGRIGFTGGMNLRSDCVLADDPPFPTRDLHFRVRGPVLERLSSVFASDWAFTTGEALEGPAWSSEREAAGCVLARTVPDGPDEDFEKLHWAVLGAIVSARRSLRIQTPYFLPETPLTTALILAALRGVEVDIVLPSENNHPVIHWASRGHWRELLEKNCHIHLSPPPFDHTKLLLVDGRYALVGSGNLDPRSFRLNFELNLECYDDELAGRLEKDFLELRAECRRVRLEDLDARTFPGRLRDATARLFTPYL